MGGGLDVAETLVKPGWDGCFSLTLEDFSRLGGMKVRDFTDLYSYGTG